MRLYCGLPKLTSEKAVSLDESLPEAHLAMAGIKKLSWDWSSAEREYQRAIELNPNLAATHLSYGFYLSIMSRHEEAIYEIKKAIDLDPLKRNINSDIAYVFYFARNYEKALEQYEIGTELGTNFSGNFYGIGLVYASQGQYAEAIANYRETIKINGNLTGVDCYLGYALAKSGKINEAQAILKKLEDGKEYVSPVEKAVLYVGLNETEKALSELQKAMNQKDSQLQFLGVEPHFDTLRNNPGFANLIREVGLPQQKYRDMMRVKHYIYIK